MVGVSTSCSCKKRVSRSSRAGLMFPVGRIHRLLKNEVNLRVGMTAAVYFTTVLEYLTTEVLELAGDVCKVFKRKRVTPRHVLLGIKGDEELDKLIKATIAGGGVVPYIQKALLKKPRRKTSKKLALPKKLEVEPEAVDVKVEPEADVKAEMEPEENRV